MSFSTYTTGIYSGAKKFVTESEKSTQYALGAAGGAMAFGAYGAGKGVISSDSTVIGGGVGGASFGAAVGAGAAILTHKSKGVREFLGSALNKAGSVTAKGNP